MKCENAKTYPCFVTENYLLALCDGNWKSDLLQLLEVIDVTKASSANKTKIFTFLGRLSLESCTEMLLWSFKDRGYAADTISKLIFNYAISAPNLAVEDVVSEFKNWHLLLEMEPHLKSYEEMVVYCCEVHEVRLFPCFEDWIRVCNGSPDLLINS